MAEPTLRRFQLKLPGRRAGLFALVGACLLLLGFYSATDASRLDNSAALNLADYAGYTVCHRITSHSFVFAGRQMPLCARCTGIYLGISLVFGVLLLAGRGRWTELPSLSMLLGFGFLVAVMGVDGLNSYSHFFANAPHLYEPKNWLRLTTGMGTGLGMGSIALPALAQTLWQHPVRQASITSWREMLGLLALAAVLILLVLSNQPALLYVLSLASAGGVLAILTTLNTVMLLLILRRDGRAERWSQAVVPLAIGLGLTVLEIALVSTLRFSLTGTMTGFPGL
ncbi:MAG TPA: DUF2085 domain-containing protein [Candidatus Binatia bacterium]|jgi:uncharacterized membrane protein|nr:DUF2085 domain-containing protein [Candidatus Binatia bacterium]